MNKHPIYTNNIPRAFSEWLKRKGDEADYISIEVNNGEVVVVRVKYLIVDGVDPLQGLKYGKIVSDSSGVYLEETFRPQYNPTTDKIENLKN